MGGAHAVINTQTIPLGAFDYKPFPVQGELSLKVGWFLPIYTTPDAYLALRGCASLDRSSHRPWLDPIHAPKRGLSFMWQRGETDEPSSRTYRRRCSEVGRQDQEGRRAGSGNDRIEASGRANELEGNARVETSLKLGERAKGKVEEVTGVIKNRLGKLIGNEQMKAEGKARKLQGEARQRVNK